jgi:hypothetical protein
LRLVLQELLYTTRRWAPSARKCEGKSWCRSRLMSYLSLCMMFWLQHPFNR